jgi:hypothetical protein
MRFATRFAFTLICFASLALAGCKSKPRDPFPASSEVSGWQKTDNTRTFAAQDLWQYIDGDAEQYIQAGVVTTSTADYKFNNQLEAVVDVHTIKDGPGADRILQTGRSNEARSEKIGDAGYSYSQSVVFRKGPYLVRIVAWQSTPGTQQALIALAHGVEAKL